MSVLSRIEALLGLRKPPPKPSRCYDCKFYDPRWIECSKSFGRVDAGLMFTWCSGFKQKEPR